MTAEVIRDQDANGSEQIPGIITFLSKLREWEGAEPFQLREFRQDETIGTVLVRSVTPPTPTFYPGANDIQERTGREIRVSPTDTKEGISWLAKQRINSDTPQEQIIRLANIGITLSRIQALQPGF
jgi:hypothetical protein